MKCEDVSLTKIEKWATTPEGRHVKYWDVIHKKKCSNELHNIKEEEENKEYKDVEDEEKTNENDNNDDKHQPDTSNDNDDEMAVIREHFVRFMKK